MKHPIIIAGLLLFGILAADAQETPFDPGIYTDFVSANEDISPAKLHALYPSDIFREAVTPFAEQDVLYLNEAINAYDMSDDERGLIKKNGFAVTERLSFGSYFRQFQDVYKKDLPVFISTDAILHAVHLSYDELLKQVELRYLIPELKEMLELAHSGMKDLDQKYGADEAMMPMLRDVDVYFSVPLILLGEDVSPFYSENVTVIAELLSLIDNEDMKPVIFFSQELVREVDFSQFKPRGHYEVEEWENQELPEYFRAMMWMGRMELYLDHPLYEDIPEMRETVHRQIIDAILIHEILSQENILQIYNGMEDIISFFVGKQDNVSLPAMNELINESGIEKANELQDDLIVQRFLHSLRSKPYAGQQILSQVLMENSRDSASSQPSAFMPFGQRFVIDSYVTGQVVFDRILYQEGKPCRLLPSTLDIMFAMGNDAATQLLIPELHQWKYSDNLAGLRFLIDQYPEEFWESSLYNMWLYAIKSLNPDPKDERTPEFMKTGAWGLEKLNTQLSSWAELRHDNLLYAKQSYTVGGQCSHPEGYVEPNPEFFKRMKRMADIAGEKFSELAYLWKTEWGELSPAKYFDNMYAICDTLETISEKELSGLELTDRECSFFDDVAFAGPHGSGGPSFNGWYADLVYSAQNLLEDNLVVADYHTVPYSCGGIPLGWVAHAGTGQPDMMIAVANLANGQACAFMGPVASYHEYRTSDFLRLTDSEWETGYLDESLRPEWVYGYLADQSGQNKESSLKLYSDMESLREALQSGITSYGPDRADRDECLLNISPNPVTQSTLISIRISEEMRSKDTRLMIYNIEGKLIKNLVNGALPPGNYITRWDRTSEAASLVPPGMYILRMVQEGYEQTTKLLVAD